MDAAERPIEHGDARAALDEAFLARRLDTVSSDPSVAAHLARCPSCGAELAALRATAELLVAGAPDAVSPSEDARGRVLSAIRQTGRPRPVTTEAPVPSIRRRTPAWAGLAAAAGVALLLAGGFLGLSAVTERDAAERDAQRLSAVQGRVEQVMLDPDHREVVLQASDGRPSGMVLFQPANGELVVFSSAQVFDTPGGDYPCFVKSATGAPERIGEMHVARGVWFWAGPVEAVRDIAPGSALFVVREGSESGEIVLSGEL